MLGNFSCSSGAPALSASGLFECQDTDGTPLTGVPVVFSSVSVSVSDYSSPITAADIGSLWSSALVVLAVAWGFNTLGHFLFPRR